MGCDGPHRGVTGPDDLRLAMAQASIAEARAVYDSALVAEQRGERHRPMLLRAVVDALQFGAPMHDVTITIGGAQLPFRATAIESVVSRTLGETSATFLLAWSADAQRLLVVATPDGIGLFAPVAFYLNGTDTPLTAASGSAALVSAVRVLEPCAHEAATPLTGPPATSCQFADIRVDLDLMLGPAGASQTAVSATGMMLTGVRVVRPEAGFAPLRALLGDVSPRVHH